MCASCPVAATLAPVTSARQQPTPTPPSLPPSPRHQSRPVSRPPLFAHGQVVVCPLGTLLLWYTGAPADRAARGGAAAPLAALRGSGRARCAASAGPRTQQCSTRRGVGNGTRAEKRHLVGARPWPPRTRIAKPERRHALRLHASSTGRTWLHTHHTHSAPPPLRSHERQLCPRSSSVAPLSIRLATHAQVGLAMRERYPVLRDISASIQTRRTVEESELALKLEKEFRADPCRKQCRQRGPKRLFGRGCQKLGAT